MSKLRNKATKNKAALKDHMKKAKEQKKQCQDLHTRLQVMRLCRNEQARVDAKAKEDVKLRQEKIKSRRQQRFRLRQRQQWAQIRTYRRNQEEIKAERKFQLHQELKATVKYRRDRALQDFIRVNLR